MKRQMQVLIYLSYYELSFLSIIFIITILIITKDEAYRIFNSKLQINKIN